MKQTTKKEKIIYMLTLFYLIPLGLLLIANTLFSLFQTTYMELYQDTEKPLYKADNPILLLILTLIFLSLCALSFHKKEISAALCKKAEKFVLVYSVILCLSIIFIYRVRVACDSQFLSDIAIAFLNGDYSSLSGDEYLAHYPHQLGMVALLQMTYYVFGIENFIVLQILNVCAIFSTVYFMHRITEELFHDFKIQFLLSLLCTLLLPLYLYSTFIYGDIPGLGLVVPALYLVIRYLNTKKRLLLLPAFFCMTLSIILKSNNFVILAAVFIILLLHSIKEKDWFAVVFALVLLLSPPIGNTCINNYYANASGLEQIPSGIPKVAWIAMGLQKNDYIENGWYNSYNWSIYTQCNFDTEKTTEACMTSIQNSISSFLSAPKSGLHFFYKKFISQWNDPGFQAQITNEWYSRHRDDHSSLALYLIYGNGRLILEGIMNLYHFLILLGASVFTVRSLKDWSLPSALLALSVFGGYFFHMIWEAGGRYGLGYFVLCVPMAAYGIEQLINFIMQIFTKIKLSK